MHLAALMPWPLPKVRPEVRIFQPPWRLMCLPHQDSLRQLLECHQSWESSLSSSVSMWDMSPWCLPPPLLSPPWLLESPWCMPPLPLLSWLLEPDSP